MALPDLKTAFTKLLSPAAAPVTPAANLMRNTGRATQDVIGIVDARDNMLFLSDGSVVGGVRIFSISPFLLTPEDIQRRVLAYRDLILKHASAPFQWWIGSRPQVLDTHVGEVSDRLVELVKIEIALREFASKLTPYVSGDEQSLEAFQIHFGHAPSDFAALPGDVHRIARELCDGAHFAELRARAALPEYLAQIDVGVDKTLAVIASWADRLRASTEFLVQHTTQLGTPVRTLHILVSSTPRIVKRAGPLDAREIEIATREINAQCAHFLDHFDATGMAATRASHEDLLREIQFLFHPSATDLATARGESPRSLAAEQLQGLT